MFSLKKGVVQIFATKILVALTGLITVIFTSRYLGAEGRGAISLFTSMVALLQLFCDYGSNSAIINLSYRMNQWRLWLSAVRWVSGICLSALVIVFGFRQLPFIALVPLAAFLFSLVNIHNLLLMGNRQVNKRNFILLLQPLLLLLFFILSYHFLDMHVKAYPLAFVSALAVSMVVSYSFIRATLKSNKQAVADKFEFESELLKQGFWVQTGHVIQFLNYRINFFLIVFFIGNAALGIYNNAIVIAESLWMLGHSIGQIMHMKILNSEGDKLHRQVTVRMLGYSFAGALVMLIVLLLIPATFWEWLFSEEFNRIGGLLFYLAPGILFFSISNILNHYFHAKGRFRLIVWCNLSGLVSGLSGCLLLVPQYGLEGACMAWSAGLLVSMLVYVFSYFKLSIFSEKSTKKNELK